MAKKKPVTVDVDHSDEGIMGTDAIVENTKDGKFIPKGTNEPPTNDGLIAIKAGQDPEKERFLKHNDIMVRKREKEEVLRLAELDVKRTYESAQLLFKNACDYIHNTIVPVFGRHDVLSGYSVMLDKWLGIIEEWADGIPMGHDADWDIINEKIAEIKKETTKLNSQQSKIKEQEIGKRKDELKAVNEELSEFEKS